MKPGKGEKNWHEFMDEFAPNIKAQKGPPMFAAQAGFACAAPSRSHSRRMARPNKRFQFLVPGIGIGMSISRDEMVKRAFFLLLGMSVMGAGRSFAKTGAPPPSAPLFAPNLTPPFHGTLQMPFGAPLKKPVKGISLSSLALFKKTPQKTILTDYENLRLSWQGPMPCFARWRCDIHLGWDHQSAGFMDGFIEDYHKSFSFPEGSRPGLPVNGYGFQVQGGGASLAGGKNPNDTFTNPVLRMVRPRFGGEGLIAVSLPLMSARDSALGKVVGLGVGWQKRNLHRRVSLVGVGLSGGHALTGQAPVAWHWQGQLSLAPPTWKKRRHTWTIFAQGQPMKGAKAVPFKGMGLMLQVEMQVKPGSANVIRFSEDLENAQDFSLGYYWL